MNDYVIKNEDKAGWAAYDGIEGWHFTIVYAYAYRFRTHEDAMQCIKDNYSNCGYELRVEKVETR